jgi:hypothetical protein
VLDEDVEQQPENAAVLTSPIDKTGDAPFHHHQNVSLGMKIMVSPGTTGGIVRDGGKDIQSCCTAEVPSPAREASGSA